MAEEVHKLDHKVLNLRDATSNMMTKTATSLSSKQDSSPGSWLTTLDERIRELGILLCKDEETLKALKDMKHSLRAANVLKRESINQLQERMPACAPSQTEEIDTFAKHRAEAIKSRSTTDRRLVGPQQRRISNCSKEHSKIHNFYTKASILSLRGIVDLKRV
jgi:uncharacterized coiled-coil protein SlyX